MARNRFPGITGLFILLCSLTSTGAAAQTGQSSIVTSTATTLPVSGMRRFPNEDNAHWDVRSSQCFNNGLSAEESRVTLRDYKHTIDAWRESYVPGQSLGPPHFPRGCRWRSSDALVGAAYFEDASTWLYRKNEGYTKDRRNVDAAVAQPAKTRGNVASLIITAVMFSIIFLVIGLPVRPLSRFEKQLVSAGTHDDTWAAYRRFMTPRLRNLRRIEYCIFGGVLFISIVGLLVGGPTAFFEMAFILASVAALPAGILFLVIKSRALHEAQALGLIYTGGRQPKLVPRVRAPAARGEHGIAHALGAAQAQAEGFAERDGPPQP